MIFWEKNICSSQSAVQETILSRTVRHFLWMLNHAWMVCLLLIWDMVIKVLRSDNNTVEPKHNDVQETCATPVSQTKTQNATRSRKD